MTGLKRVLSQIEIFLTVCGPRLAPASGWAVPPMANTFSSQAFLPAYRASSFLPLVRKLRARVRKSGRAVVRATAALLTGLFAGLSDKPVIAHELVPPAAVTDMNTALLAMPVKERETFLADVAGSTMFVVAQQSSRMLMSQLNLPVRGEIETTIDTLTALYLINSTKTALKESRTLAIRSALAITSKPRSQWPKFFRYQNINRKRVERILCLLVGSNPDVFSSLREGTGMSDEQVSSCVREYEKTEQVWSKILANHLRKEGDDTRRMAVSYNKVPRGDEILVEMLKQSQILENAARELDDFYRFPAPVIMRAASCGEETAYFDPRTRDFLICYDLILRFATDHLEQMNR